MAARQVKRFYLSYFFRLRQFSFIQPNMYLHWKDAVYLILPPTLPFLLIKETTRLMRRAI
jgi:hypothetical protein